MIVARIAGTFIALGLKVKSRWWRVRFQLAAWSRGGRVTIGKDVRFLSPVVFLGSGAVVLGDGVSLGFPPATASRRPIMLQPRDSGAVITIGQGTAIVNGTEMIARGGITVGKNCRIGARCVILDSDFHSLDPSRRDDPGPTRPVEIGDGVWLGLEVVVLKGMRIGDNSVVAARSVVTAPVPRASLVAPPQSRQQPL